MGQVVDAAWGLSPLLVYGLVGVLAFLDSAGVVGVVVPGTLALLIGGAASVVGMSNVVVVLAVGVVAAVVGDGVGYVRGRARRVGTNSWVGVDRWREAECLVEECGGRAAVFGRRSSALRALVPAVAGRSGVPGFLRWSVLGGLLWSVIVVGLGCAAGFAALAAQEWFGDAAALVIGVVLWAALLAWMARVSIRHRVIAQALGTWLAGTSVCRGVFRWIDSLVRRSGVGPAAAMIMALGALVVASSTALLANLFDDLLEGDGLLLLDHPILEWLASHRDPAFTLVMIVITEAGGMIAMACAATSVTLWCAWHRRWWAAATVATTALGAGVLVSVGKAAVGRARPPRAGQLVVETNQSFPSGHALFSVAVLGVLAAVAVYSQRRWAARVWTVAGAVFAIGLIGFTRLYLGVHWPTDILAGWLIATAWVTLCMSVAATLRYRSAYVRSLGRDRGPVS